jgi:superoxide dismutase, Cu-Zn family
MKEVWIVVSLVLLCGAMAFGQSAAPMAQAELQNSQGETVGLATFSEGVNGVMIVAHVHNMEPGFHGFHIHETGKCTPPDFKSAGDHFNPFEARHGSRNPDGPHAGDLPNLPVSPDGTGVIVTYAPLVTLSDGKNSLFSSAGTALVLHKMPGDLKTDPAGNAGDRVACGRIIKLGKEKHAATAD